MSKYSFFAKKGRPSTQERAICKKINSLIDSGEITRNQIEEYTSTTGVPETQDDLEILYAMLTGEEAIPTNNPKKSNNSYSDENADFDDTYEEEIKETPNMSAKSESSSNPIDFTPFEEPVIERGYTKGFQQEEDIPNDYQNFEQGGSDFQFSEDELKRPPIEEDIPEPEWASSGGSVNDTITDAEYTEEVESEGEGSEKLGGDNLQDLSPQQKRKSAEKTADAILGLYCNFAPLPFKKWASFNEAKINKLVFEDKLDMNMRLEDNVSVRDYIKGTNEQVEEIFEVSDEQREEIKEPLVDVLLEQDLALTPTQRLLLAVGGHIITMGMSAFQLAQNNKVALESFQKYHQEFKSQSVGRNTPPKGSSSTRTSAQPDYTQHEKDELEKIIREMDGEKIIDADTDPNVEVTEDYD